MCRSTIAGPRATPIACRHSPRSWLRCNLTHLRSHHARCGCAPCEKRARSPIVFAQVSDPVGSGFVASLARPGGNVTGFTNINIELSIGGKWLELVEHVAPAVRPVAMIYNPSTSPFADYYLARSRPPARHTECKPARWRSTAMSISRMPWLPSHASQEADLSVLPDTFTGIHRDQIVSLAGPLSIAGGVSISLVCGNRRPAVIWYRFR